MLALAVVAVLTFTTDTSVSSVHESDANGRIPDILEAVQASMVVPESDSMAPPNVSYSPPTSSNALK